MKRFWRELKPAFGESADAIERAAERRELSPERYIVESAMVRAVEDEEAADLLRGVEAELELIESKPPT